MLRRSEAETWSRARIGAHARQPHSAAAETVGVLADIRHPWPGGRRSDRSRFDRVVIGRHRLERHGFERHGFEQHGADPRRCDRQRFERLWRTSTAHGPRTDPAPARRAGHCGANPSIRASTARRTRSTMATPVPLFQLGRMHAPIKTFPLNATPVVLLYLTFITKSSLRRNRSWLQVPWCCPILVADAARPEPFRGHSVRSARKPRLGRAGPGDCFDP